MLTQFSPRRLIQQSDSKMDHDHDHDHDTNDVIASFHRCRRDEAFIDTFYESFLAKSPKIAEKFAMTNFKIQKLMLRESLLEMLLFDSGTTGSREVVEELGHKHRELRVTEDMYGMWLESLCEAVRKHDPEASPELEGQWRRAMQNGINVMISAR